MTKGILGMIPIDVILKNKLLLEAFMKGDIIRAVRWLNIKIFTNYLLLSI